MKKALALTLIMALLISAVAGTMSFNLATANPIVHEHLPVITILNGGAR